MMRGSINLVKLTFALIIMLSAVSIGTAEVVFLNDGSIIIGTLDKSEAGGVSYVAYGRNIIVKPADIYKSEKSLSSLADLTVEVILLDNSVIRGKISDFDVDIGVFLDISFGVLTIPNQSIKTIVDPTRQTTYLGNDFGVHLGAGYYFPLLDPAGEFGSAFSFTAGAELRLDVLRGLYVGADANFLLTSFPNYPTSSIFILCLEPKLMYRFLDFRTQDNFLSILTPFVSLGIGGAYIDFYDETIFDGHIGNITLSTSLDLGLDIDITDNWFVRLSGYGKLILQSPAPFITAGGELEIGFQN